MSYTTLCVKRPCENVVQVELNRPEKRNAMNVAFWSEIRQCFEELNKDGNCRAVILSGAGKHFTAGLDLIDAAQPGQILSFHGDSSLDTGRKGLRIGEMIRIGQESFSVIEQCTKPVIAAVHGACLGGGVDLISACDVRYCSKDAWFQIKETDLGVAADLGTLQRFPRIIGNGSIARELALTARPFYADEAKQIGLVSRVLPDKESCLQAALDTASLIASKSQVGAQGTKISMVYVRDKSVDEGLEQIATWNPSALQSEDVLIAVQAAMQKKQAKFAKL